MIIETGINNESGLPLNELKPNTPIIISISKDKNKLAILIIRIK